MILLETNLPGVARHARGKVRDVYQVDGQLLIVATDRISAFDYILPTGIPDKGRVLTQLSIFWFDFLREITPTHFLTADISEYPDALRQHRDQLEGRSMLVKRAQMVEVECVARRIGLERVPAARHSLRHQAAFGAPGRQPLTRADFYAFDQGPDRPR
jgi:phosphoribosylaminoimidazole-succinocarboxamide synthase